MGQHHRLAQVVLLGAWLAAGSVAALAADAPASARGASPRGLDLRAPPLSHIFSPSQIHDLTLDLTEPPPDDVTIRSRRDTPACCGTFIALPWAIAHPSSAWRIFTPVVGSCPGTWCTEHGR